MVDLSDIEDAVPADDFRRANGAPLVRSVDGSKWLRYSRPSGFGKDLDDETALNIWRIDRAIEGVATTPSLAADIAAHLGQETGRKGRREKAISIGRGEEAADLGTALHAMAARVETDPGFRVPEPYDADIAAYLSALDQAGLESVEIEVHLCSDPWRAAGTADRIYKLLRPLRNPDGVEMEPGSLIIGDLKTGAKLTYNVPGFCIQMAIYADGCFYDVTTDARTPMPDKLRTDWGLLLHLPVGQGRCDLHWADLEIGREGARIVKQIRAWRDRDDFIASFEYPPSDEVAVLSSPIYELENAPAPPPENAEEWLVSLLPWAQQRINVIGQHSDARALLLRRWPEDVPPLRAGGVTPHQLARVLDLLDTIEGAFSLPWPEADPRVEWQAGVHKSQVIRGNMPHDGLHPISGES